METKFKNGNKCITVKIGDARAFSIQTNGNLPNTHRTGKVDRQEIVEWIRAQGTKDQNGEIENLEFLRFHTISRDNHAVFKSDENLFRYFGAKAWKFPKGISEKQVKSRVSEEDLTFFGSDPWREKECEDRSPTNLVILWNKET